MPRSKLFTGPLLAIILAALAAAQQPASNDDAQAPGTVQVNPQARDEEIQERIEGILGATEWFERPAVRVNDGVVFLGGVADDDAAKTWAGNLARNTQDVVAVVNQMTIDEPPFWNFRPALEKLDQMGQAVIRGTPVLAFALVVLGIALLGARFGARAARTSLRLREINPLLRNVIARTVGIFIFLVGLYVVFQVAGLTTVALTVMGGTGLLGIVLGIAFRDITENLLASIFLSFQNPFRNGDLIEIEGVMGLVQQLTIRATVLMTVDGNHVQIPNATVYKSKIINYSSNPNRREEFVVGVGYDDSIAEAQSVALRVLRDHPSVLEDPEPWVLVDSLGAATVNLRIYFWFNGHEHSQFKVRSSVIRLVKRAFQTAGISMPDEAREMIFPNGIQVRLTDQERAVAEEQPTAQPQQVAATEPDAVSTDAEAGLSSEAEELEKQARQSRTPEGGENLLKPAE